MSPAEQVQRPAFPGQISDAEIRQSYRPDPSIQTEIWNSMFSKIKVTNVEETIRDLPSGKAPGENGFTYEKNFWKIQHLTP
jgi:hypothetical protein